MPYAELNGINIHYEVRGSGPPLLMMAPGGFDSTIEKWTTSGIWVGVKPLETLTARLLAAPVVLGHDNRICHCIVSD